MHALDLQGFSSYRVDHLLMARWGKCCFDAQGLAERTHSDALGALGAPRPRFRGEGPLTRRSYCARVVPGALTSTSTLKYNRHVQLTCQPLFLKHWRAGAGLQLLKKQRNEGKFQRWFLKTGVS